jgi:hypothetical protein
MDVYYVSHWKRRVDGLFDLNGVVGASPREVLAYFPNGAEEESEFRRLPSAWRDAHSQDTPVVWLRQLAQSGNGVTEEYDEVRVIAARSLKQALVDAYAQTLEEYGSPIDLYSETPVLELEDLGDPFTPVFTAETGAPAVRGRIRRRSTGRRETTTRW